MLNPELAAEMKLDHDAFIFEINYSSIELPDLRSFVSSEYYPSSRRDLSFLISNEVIIDEIITEIKRLKIKELKDTIVFDLFDKKHGETTQKSISIGLIFQAKSRTLKDAEIDEFISKVIKMLEDKFSNKY